jgi:hypothetical protein
MEHVLVLTLAADPLFAIGLAEVLQLSTALDLVNDFSIYRDHQDIQRLLQWFTRPYLTSSVGRVHV